MKKKKINKKIIKKISDTLNLHGSLELNNEFEKLIHQLDELAKSSDAAENRLQDLEIHASLSTRLLTSLCIEKFGMRVGVLKRMIKRIEKEAIRDSQIMHLESLYKLPIRPEADKNKKSRAKGESDPWEDIA
ncbi:MAG: hypothetical protein EXS63_06510 [Candidatus Omnitrophica bacterium]|nr:hypothetical protein [Candidatus Omnitrophota bacterium]